ncbi:hypothetical protein D623_10015518 [Myotis brandtii]|uniref:Uncharacterized protein n=1 Tax=Myotis brandtii TaxID=109478 RepID=S7NKZ7_MYOBR|nr:hypothetical protein D623_10015518 [Myotis brandtii]
MEEMHLRMGTLLLGLSAGAEAVGGWAQWVGADLNNIFPTQDDDVDTKKQKTDEDD